MPIDRMIEKAYELVQKKRIERVGDGVYNVVGEHGTYLVAQRTDGTFSCTCPGFLKRGGCSHLLAVLLLHNPALLRSVKRYVSGAWNRKSKRKKPIELNV
ncbi:SWIM zinc finger family protein [Candidatus Bathyarchaeota archaeon]|nr:MAG: SWIM zinc finger family protein [Candidatus Bathyarchaeota archaeon]